MSLYGSLFAGVSGLKSQSNKIGIVSDNIANVNTIGYKQGSAQFETLVVNSSNSVSYAPGGAIGGNRQLVDKQGLIQATDAPTDIAISGGGFFVVNPKDDGSGQVLYTRAGSFRQDSLGNFVNAAGFFLQGWPLDREGRLPGEVGNLNTISSANLDSVETVNVQSASGVAAATTAINIGANLDAGEVIYPGAGVDMPVDALSTNNATVKQDDIIVSNEYGAATPNDIARGDAFTVTTGSSLSYTYTYGGYAVGRDATTGAVGDGGVVTTTVLPAASFAVGAASTTVTVTHAGHNFGPVGSTRYIAVSGIVAGDIAGVFGSISDVNGTRLITVTGAGTYTFQATSASLGASAGFGAAGAVDDFAGNVLDATSATQALLSTNSTSQFTNAARTFTIATATTGTVTFTYTTASPNSLLGQFNTLNNLATAINDVAGLTARVVSGRLYVGSEDANEAVTFANGDAAGSGTLGGIDWVTELDLANVAAGANRFSTIQGLGNLVNNSSGISATITNPLSDATIRIFNDDPLDTIRFQDFLQTPATALGANPYTSTAGAGGVPITITIAQAGHSFVPGDNIVLAGSVGFDGILATELDGTHTITAVVPGVSYDITITPVGASAGVAGGGGAAVTVAQTNIGSILAELGAVTSLNGGAYVRGDTGNLGPAYDSSGAVGDNMASGDIVAQFSRNVRIYDALGSGHDLRLSFIKIATNQWAVEVHAIPETDVNTTLVDGQVAVGTIDFNGDGSLRSVSASLSNALTINWTNGAVASTVTLNWGTAGQPFGTVGATAIGLTDGLSQFDADYNVAFIDQNGAPVGDLISVTIDAEGFVIAAYSNGETQRVYKLPIADFNNPNGLEAKSGNVFAQTRDSGEVNLREAGTNGTGNVVSGALEASNVDLAEQLTDLIVAQRAYQANTRVIKATDELLQELNQL